MTKKRSKFVRIARWALIFAAILLAIPPVQIAGTILGNPRTSLMQWQRKLENRSGVPQRPILWVPLEDIPVPLIHFIWASEDQMFFRHRGFDLPQLLKAVQDAGGRGASTITMQCARSVFLWQGRSYIRKGLEAYYTLWMELLLSKRRILELYLNHIELGPGIYGVGAAAEAHFQKSPGQLTRRQMIALAAILPNPLEWSPSKPNATVERKIRRIERLSSRATFPVSELKASPK
ncbi:MAG TPA: biosynthetic peptidoglycan transglycosylase [Terrimicrobiaceae bacterium]|nr:biosynthetic peptidoglycan transglycosylase [Terrimicrobiaceae bacterium]